MGGMKGLGGAISSALPYAGAAAGGYAQGMQNKRQLEQGERALLLQEAENEMRKRGLALDETRTAASYGPTSDASGKAFGQALEDPSFGAALSGMPYNQAESAATLRQGGNRMDAQANLARNRPHGGKSNRDLADEKTKEIRMQRQALVRVKTATFPRQLQEALVREDPNVMNVYQKYADRLTPDEDFYANEIMTLILQRADLDPEYYSVKGAPAAGQPQPGPVGKPKAAGKSKDVVGTYNPATGQVE